MSTTFRPFTRNSVTTDPQGPADRSRPVWKKSSVWTSRLEPNGTGGTSSAVGAAELLGAGREAEGLDATDEGARERSVGVTGPPEVGSVRPESTPPPGLGKDRDEEREEREMPDETELDGLGLDDLVRAAQAGDGAALDEVLVRIRPLVMKRCARFLPHRMDAEEAAQDALLAVSRKLDTFTGRGSFLGWVTVISSNSARSTYRSLRRRAETTGATAVPETVDPRTTSVIAGTRLDLLDSVDELQLRHPTLVDAFVLRDLGALSYEQIAEITQAPLGTVKDRIHQARKFVRERLRLQPDADRPG